MILPSSLARQKIIKVLKHKWTLNALMLYLWSNPLAFNSQRIVGLCKSLMVNAVNFLKVGND
jgi:hypothetical protein